MLHSLDVQLVKQLPDVVALSTSPDPSALMAALEADLAPILRPSGSGSSTHVLKATVVLPGDGACVLSQFSSVSLEPNVTKVTNVSQDCADAYDVHADMFCTLQGCMPEFRQDAFE